MVSGGEDGEVEWEEEEGSGWGRCFFGGRNTGDAVRAVEGKRRRLGNERRSGTAFPAAEGPPPRLAAVGSSSLSSPARNSAATAVALAVIHLHDTSLTLCPVSLRGRLKPTSCHHRFPLKRTGHEFAVLAAQVPPNA